MSCDIIYQNEWMDKIYHSRLEPYVILTKHVQKRFSILCSLQTLTMVHTVWTILYGICPDGLKSLQKRQ